MHTEDLVEILEEMPQKIKNKNVSIQSVINFLKWTEQSVRFPEFEPRIKRMRIFKKNKR